MLSKERLADGVQQITGKPKHECETMVEALLNVMKRAFISGDGVMLKGFGTFRVCERQAHDARNPKTGQIVSVPASKSVRFKCSKDLRNAL